MTDSSKWLTTAEVAKLLDLSAKYVREDVIKQAGFPVPMRFGEKGRFKWSRVAIEKWMTHQQRRRRKKKVAKQ